MNNCGVFYIAYGKNAVQEMKCSIDTLPKNLSYQMKLDGTTASQAHWDKSRVFAFSPYQHTLFLDADTRIHDWVSLKLGFAWLKQGLDMVIVPSWPTFSGDILWHLTAEEKKYTFETLGYFSHVMLNTGVMFFTKNTRVESFFASWEQEWFRFKSFDQGAFLRALHKNPIKLGLLGKDFNSLHGKIVEHRFGHCSFSKVGVPMDRIPTEELKHAR